MTELTTTSPSSSTKSVSIGTVDDVPPSKQRKARFVQVKLSGDDTERMNAAIARVSTTYTSHPSKMGAFYSACGTIKNLWDKLGRKYKFGPSCIEKFDRQTGIITIDVEANATRDEKLRHRGRPLPSTVAEDVARTLTTTSTSSKKKQKPPKK